MSLGVLLFVLFVALLMFNIPIAAALGIASLVVLMIKGTSLSVLAMLLYSAIAKFTLLAVPFFIMAGVIMEKAGISSRLIKLANAAVGHLPGGLAIVGILTCMFFAAISGSGPATVAALGVIMIPAMIRAGYDPRYSSALMANAGAIGIIIPPSIPFVIYGVIAETSIARLFIAGIIPGIIMGGLLMIASYLLSVKYNWRGEKRASVKEFTRAFVDAFWGLMTPVIILGGIYGGFFTPTEAAAVAVVWGLFVGVFVYKEIKWKQFVSTMVDSAVATAVVMLVVASASIFAWIVTTEGVTVSASQSLLSLSDSRIVILLMINVILLIAGCFIDAISAFYIFTPILLPVVTKLGMDPVVFGIVMTVNLAIGQITPPVGVNLYVACGISKISLKDISSGLWPFLIASLIALLLVTYIPSISLWLPGLLGIK